MPAIKARYWMLTVPKSDWTPPTTINAPFVYWIGQQEIGSNTGYEHWQCVFVLDKQYTFNQAKAHFPNSAHIEPTISAAANDYCSKSTTAVANTQFELGKLPVNRGKRTDWDRVYQDATTGNFDEIPKDIVIRHYSSLKRIRVDNSTPPTRPEINVTVYWGASGTGKTRRAWFEAGDNVYIKNPNTKWWDGYKGQSTVIIDEFTGRIDLSYLLTWFDRYPCNVEVKGYSTPLLAINFFVTSNIDPNDWYTDVNEEQRRGLLRRLSQVVFFSSDNPWSPPESLNLIETLAIEEDVDSLINDLFS